MKKFILILIILAYPFVSNSQVTEEWVKNYNGPGDSVDYAVSLAVDNSGNIYVTGNSDGSGTLSDYCTIKYSPNGDSLWVRRYNGPGNGLDVVSSIAVDNSGNVYVTGSSWGSGTLSDYCTIKYNPNGDSLWLRRYNGPGVGIDWVQSIAVDNSGNVYVTGSSARSGTVCDYCTIKYNSDGDSLWVRRYSGPGNSDGAFSIAVDNSGNVYVTGGSVGNGTGSDYCTIKYNSNGDSLWVRRYNGPGNNSDQAISLALDNSGNVYVTGSSYGIGTLSDYCTIKYSPNGDSLWVRRYNGPWNRSEGANSIAVDISGNIYVIGSSYGSWLYNNDYCTIKYNSNGDSLWVRIYDGPGNTDDYAESIALDNSGNVYVTGCSSLYGTNGDYCTIKYDSIGTQRWVQIYNGQGNGNDCAFSIVADNSGNVYVTGWSYGTTTYDDYCTIKYHDLIGIKLISNGTPKEYSLSQNYPNPFNPTTKIKFDIPRSGDVKLVIYDILGREVTTLVNQDLKPGVYEVEWNASNKPSGVYFYKLTTADFTETKRMVLIK